MKKYSIKTVLLILCFIGCFTFTSCSVIEDQTIQNEPVQGQVSLANIPEYSGEPYVAVNGNIPEFENESADQEAFEQYSDLDELGRCETATADIGQELMPTEKRGAIGQVKPTGWHTVKYDNVDGKYLYNRCHLIGYQLTGENANEENLITGTRYMNVEGMLPFEDMVADYIKETDNHVLYEVVPVYEDDDLVAKGVEMMGYSLEDEGESISFNVFVYNVQPGITIDYATGESHLSEDDENTKTVKEGDGTEQLEIRGNSKSKIYHCPGQQAYEEMGDSKHLVIFHTEQEAQEAGYRKAQR